MVLVVVTNCMCYVYQGGCIVHVVYTRVAVLCIPGWQCCVYQGGCIVCLVYTWVAVLYMLCISWLLYCTCSVYQGDIVYIVHTGVTVLCVFCKLMVDYWFTCCLLIFPVSIDHTVYTEQH